MAASPTLQKPDGLAGHPFPLAAPSVRQDPFPYYAWLRETDPCHDAGGIWLISRFEDVNSLFRDRRLSSDLRNAREPLLTGALDGSLKDRPARPLEFLHRGVNAIERRVMEYLTQFSMIGIDPPDHTRMRRLVRSAFTPAAVAKVEDRVAERAGALLDRVGDQPFDLIAGFGYPLPLQVVTDLLGIPATEEARMRRWSDALSRSVDPATSTAVRRRGFQASLEFTHFLGGLIRERRANPSDDLLSDLVGVADAGGDGGLNRGELVGNVMLLIIAGHETTTNLIGNGTLALMRHPDQLELLRERPDLAASAVEEVLRWDSPGQLAYRTALEPISLHGRTIEAGDQLILLVGSANRDSEVFDDPDSFEIERERAKNIAFGAGPHFCLGAPLARLEGRIAFTTLLERGTPRLVRKPRYRDNLVHRGLTELRVELAQPDPAG